MIAHHSIFAFVAFLWTIAHDAFASTPEFDRVGYIRASVELESIAKTKPLSKHTLLTLEKIHVVGNDHSPETIKESPKSIAWISTEERTWRATTNHEFVVSLEDSSRITQWLVILSAVDESGTIRSLQTRIFTMDPQRPLVSLQLNAQVLTQTPTRELRIWHIVLAIISSIGAVLIVGSSGAIAKDTSTKNTEESTAGTRSAETELAVTSSSHDDSQANDQELTRTVPQAQTSGTMGLGIQHGSPSRSFAGTPTQDLSPNEADSDTELSRQLEQDSEEDADELWKPPKIQRNKNLAIPDYSQSSHFPTCNDTITFQKTQHHGVPHSKPSPDSSDIIVRRRSTWAHQIAKATPAPNLTHHDLFPENRGTAFTRYVDSTAQLQCGNRMRQSMRTDTKPLQEKRGNGVFGWNQPAATTESFGILRNNQSRSFAESSNQGRAEIRPFTAPSYSSVQRSDRGMFHSNQANELVERACRNNSAFLAGLPHLSPVFGRNGPTNMNFKKVPLIETDEAPLPKHPVLDSIGTFQSDTNDFGALNNLDRNGAHGSASLGIRKESLVNDTTCNLAGLSIDRATPTSKNDTDTKDKVNETFLRPSSQVSRSPQMLPVPFATDDHSLPLATDGALSAKADIAGPEKPKSQVESKYQHTLIHREPSQSLSVAPMVPVATSKAPEMSPWVSQQPQRRGAQNLATSATTRDTPKQEQTDKSQSRDISLSSRANNTANRQATGLAASIAGSDLHDRKEAVAPTKNTPRQQISIDKIAPTTFPQAGATTPSSARQELVATTRAKGRCSTLPPLSDCTPTPEPTARASPIKRTVPTIDHNASDDRIHQSGGAMASPLAQSNAVSPTKTSPCQKISTDKTAPTTVPKAVTMTSSSARQTMVTTRARARFRPPVVSTCSKLPPHSDCTPAPESVARARPIKRSVPAIDRKASDDLEFDASQTPKATRSRFRPTQNTDISTCSTLPPHSDCTPTPESMARASPIKRNVPAIDFNASDGLEFDASQTSSKGLSTCWRSSTDQPEPRFDAKSRRPNRTVEERKSNIPRIRDPIPEIPVSASLRAVHKAETSDDLSTTLRTKKKKGSIPIEIVIPDESRSLASKDSTILLGRKRKTKSKSLHTSKRTKTPTV